MKHPKKFFQAMMLNEERKHINEIIDMTTDVDLKIKLLQRKRQIVQEINYLVRNKVTRSMWK